MKLKEHEKKKLYTFDTHDDDSSYFDTTTQNYSAEQKKKLSSSAIFLASIQTQKSFNDSVRQLLSSSSTEMSFNFSTIFFLNEFEPV